MSDVTFSNTITAGTFVGSDRHTVSSGNLNILDEAIPGSSTNLPFALVIDVSKLAAMALMAVGGTLTLNFNDVSGGSPSKTMILLDGLMFNWDSGCLHANPFGVTDVTDLFVTKAGAGAVQLTGFILVDPT